MYTHTHICIYIYIYTHTFFFFAAFGGGLGNFGGLLLHFLERGHGASFSFPGVLLHQSEPVTGPGRSAERRSHPRWALSLKGSPLIRS